MWKISRQCAAGPIFVNIRAPRTMPWTGITPEWNKAHAFFSTCMGRPLLSVEIRDGETGKTVSRNVYNLDLQDLRERGMVEEFTTAAERRRIERGADNGRTFSRYLIRNTR